MEIRKFSKVFGIFEAGLAFGAMEVIEHQKYPTRKVTMLNYVADPECESLNSLNHLYALYSNLVPPALAHNSHTMLRVPDGNAGVQGP